MPNHILKGRRKLAVAILGASLANGCSGARPIAVSDWESRQCELKLLIERQIVLLDRLNLDYINFGHEESKIQSAEFAANWLNSLLDMAADRDLQLLLTPPIDNASFADRISAFSVDQVHRLYGKLAYPSAREAANFMYLGAMSRPEVMAFMRDVLDLDVPQSNQAVEHEGAP
jgi:hypothetical protein